MKGILTAVFVQADRSALADRELLSSFLARLDVLSGRCLSLGLSGGSLPVHVFIPEGLTMEPEEPLAHLLAGRVFGPGAALLPSIAEAAGSNAGPRDAVLLFSSPAPVLDVEGSIALIENHLRYRTHYSYSDTAVPGFFPDCLSLEFAREAPQAVSGTNHLEDLRSFVFRNIQDFDLDLHYAEPDVRMFRLSADGSTDRSRAAARRLLMQGILSHKEVENALRGDMEVLALAPSWLEIEWTTRSTGTPTVYPNRDLPSVSADGMDLPPQVAAKILSDLQTFPFARDVSVCIGGRGDPFLGQGLHDFVQALAGLNAVKAVMVETTGANLTRSMLERLFHPGLDVCVIVRLPSLRFDRYRRWMGSERLPDVLSLLDSIAAAPLPFPLYAEMIRMVENEDELDGFMERYGEAKGSSSASSGPGVRALIGHYSRYGGTLPDQAAVDLSPLVKDYCRHLAFDVFVNAAGQVPLCRQGGIGPNLMSSDLLSIYRSRRQALALSMQARFADISPLCPDCDDWYVFNG